MSIKDKSMDKCQGCIDCGPNGFCLLTGEIDSPRSYCDGFESVQTGEEDERQKKDLPI